MKKKINESIYKSMQRHLLKEEKEAKKIDVRKVNKHVNKIKSDISALLEMFEDMGIDPNCKPCKQLDRMYDIMAELDPVQKKMAKYMHQQTETVADKLIKSEADVKIGKDADRETQELATDMAKDNNMDIELKSDEEA